MREDAIQVIIQPSSVGGSIMAPASKSSMQRACAAALVRRGLSLLRNPGRSNDDQAAIGVIRGLGADITGQADGSLRISSHGVQPVQTEIHCGESGLGIRMFTPLVALSEKRITINGEGSLRNRPMDFFDEVLPQLGVEVRSQQGRLPLQIRGPLRPKNIEIDGSLSSQFLTGLLMAYSAAGASDVAIRVRNLTSRPYVDLTLKVMRDFGLNVPDNNGYESFYFTAPPSEDALSTVDYTVEGDWSGAAFLLVTGAIAGSISIKGLDIHSTQADRAVLEALSAAGADVKLAPDHINIGPAALRAFQFDATNCPDLFPPLVALAAYCRGVSVIKGVGRLAHKESNRALTLQEEFAKMNVEIRLEGDAMLVRGGWEVTGAAVHSHHDHRIAMACAVAALQAQGATSIREAQAVNKSYPDFYQHLQKLGAALQYPVIVGHP
ncbi:MAG TPA: 3-phosphoshikimate 1-carboxyvinyltransferase [Puia sp.]|nr:3-phosphoshikimate 1-carboxyvinyltransferase [Puia sp.]